MLLLALAGVIGSQESFLYNRIHEVWSDEANDTVRAAVITYTNQPTNSLNEVRQPRPSPKSQMASIQQAAPRQNLCTVSASGLAVSRILVSLLTASRMSCLPLSYDQLLVLCNPSMLLCPAQRHSSITTNSVGVLF